VIDRSGGWNLTASDFIEDNKFFRYRYKVDVDGQKLLMSYTYTARASFVEPADYNAYRKASDKVSENMVMSLEQPVLSETQAASFNWLLLATLMVAIACVVMLCIQLDKNKIMTVYETQYLALGGWLIVLGIGVTVQPLYLAYQVINDFLNNSDFDFFDIYFKKDSVFYEPMKGYFQLAVPVVNVFLLGFSTLVMIHYYKRRASFRSYYSLFKFFHFAVLLIVLLLNYFFFANVNDMDDKKLMNDAKGTLFRLFVQICIWVPYVWYSKRSRHTFTVTTPETQG
jgi:hypothetical protein